MADDPDHQLQQPRRRAGRLLEVFSSPDSYGLVLLLILVTYVLSATATATWAVSLVLFVQLATIWVTLQAAQARRRLREVTSAVLVVSAVVAILNLFLPRGPAGDGGMAVVSGLLYVAAPVVIVRHLVWRRTVDTQTVLGAIAAYLMAGMSFAFAYRALGVLQGGPFFGSQGEGTFSQDLFFSFTTLTTTGYGNLVPATNPGQTFAVGEMLIGQLFLVTAVAKVVSGWQLGQGSGRPPTAPNSN
jgi:Ion channel